MKTTSLKKLAAWWCAAALWISLFAGCTASGALDAANTPGEFPRNAVLTEIYRLDSPDYRVYSSELLDAYFIACALYFDFNTQGLLPNASEDALYTQAEAYFKAYQSHPFIRGLGKYVDADNRAQSHGVVFPLLMYAFSRIDYGVGVDTLQTDAFEDGAEFNAFLQSLYQFYSDTKAHQFFQSVKLQKEMASYLKKELKAWQIGPLLSEMEEYVGNKDTLFQGRPVKYRSVMTLYRPFNASFYTIDYGDSVYLTGQQSPSGTDLKSGSFDIGQTVSTGIHEFLHSYISQPVYEQNKLILEMARGKDKLTYAGPMYQDMEWYRIVDENIVRVAEAAVFSKVLGDEDTAFDFILRKEIEFGGMTKLQNLYDALPVYEDNRETYHTIDSYLPDLITAMFS